MKRSFPAAALILVLSLSAAAAQDEPALYEGHLDHLDTNNSGTISRAEYEAFMGDAFAELDSNKDGYLTQLDVSSILSADQFAAMDANRDGRVSRNEFMAQVVRDFETADRTNDGHLR